MTCTGDDEEMAKVAAGALASPMVQAELARLQLPEGADVICEPWPCKFSLLILVLAQLTLFLLYHRWHR